MIVRIEELEKKVKALQHMLGASDADLSDAHEASVLLAAKAEENGLTLEQEADKAAKAAREAVLLKGKK